MKTTIEGLEYIAISPAKEHGGFNATTIEIAKSALAELHAATQEIERLKGDHQRYRVALEFVVNRQNLMFAECSDAEAIIELCKTALNSTQYATPCPPDKGVV